jgi:hypothetical protein
MRMWAKGTARATLLTASFVALGAGPALADVTNGDGSVLGGNQIHAPVSAPVDVSGNAVDAVGHALAGSTGGASVRNNGDGGGQRTSGRHSVGGGNQVDAPISVPVNACGNAVAIFGQALAGCEGGAKVDNSGGGGGGGGQRTSGDHSVLGGNQVNAPISAPVNVCGNAAALLGDAVAGCKGGAKVTNGGGYQGGYNDGGYGYGDGGYGGYGDGGQRTSGRHGVGGGNQVNAPISAPVNVCGNAIGNAVAGCEGGAKVGNGGGYSHGGRHTSGDHSILGGNQVTAPVRAPVNVCGNAVAVLGDAAAGCAGMLPSAGGHISGGRTSGHHSIGGGNQVTAPVSAPVNVCGNAAAVVGQAYGSCGGDDCISPSRASASRKLSELPQLPVSPAALRSGAVPVSMGAMPALPQLPFGRPQAAQAPAEIGLVGLPGQAPIAPMSAPAGTGLVPGSSARLGDVAGLMPGSLPALPEPVDLGGQRMTPQSADARPSLPGLPGLPVVRPVPAAGTVRPVHDGFHAPSIGGPPKELPPVQTAAAESQAGLESGALLALALGGLLAASSAVVSATRRRRR